MILRAVGISILSTTLLAGCSALQSATSAPKPQAGASCVVLDVEAKPKAGIKKHVDRVTVYDAAPTAGKASGEFEHVDYESLDDIIVWLEPGPTTATAKSALKVEIDAAAKPSEKVHAASVGQEIVFRNTGSAPLSLYSVSDNNDFDLPPIAPGGEAKYAVKAEGLIEILGDPSQPPVALVYAAPSPWVASAKAGESVVFNNVAPGTYRAVSWHPRLPGKTVEISLTPDKVVHQPIAISVNNLAALAMVEP